MSSISIFTYIDRYTPFLDVWLQYYKKVIPNIHIYILHRSSSTFDLQSHISDHDLIYERRITTTDDLYVVDTHIFSDMHIELLSKYDVVLYADVDEIIMHENLYDLLHTKFDTCLVTRGIEIIQKVGIESPFQFEIDIISQRDYIIYSNWYDKALITNKSIPWVDGKHNHNLYSNYVDGLYLIHLGKICIDLFSYNWQNTIDTYPSHTIVTHDFKTHYIENFSNNVIPMPNDIKKLLNKIV
ncbi:hypothetical protein N9864_00555 [bacterium]|nr:hypothetical protein [bacterium]